MAFTAELKRTSTVTLTMSEEVAKNLREALYNEVVMYYAWQLRREFTPTPPASRDSFHALNQLNRLFDLPEITPEQIIEDAEQEIENDKEG